MGVISTIDFEKFPKQGSELNQRVKVCFYYDTNKTILGTVVRDDVEVSWRTIIRLDDGRYIEAEECQYTAIK